MASEHAFLLQRVQPAMVGLVDGSLATLAPIFAVAGGILHTLPSRARSETRQVNGCNQVAFGNLVADLRDYGT
jgi:hypothetical protein